MDPISIFGKHKIAAGEHRNFSTNSFSLGVRREKEGWMLRHTDAEVEEPARFDILSADYYHTGKSNSLLILPSLPAKPLVFKGSSLSVAPGQKLVFYLKIPLNLQVYYSKNHPLNLLREVSVTRLSDTWFGDPFSGEPACVLGNEFYWHRKDMDLSLLEAICPVIIYNNSPIVLKVERLIIRVENMTLYKNERSIVTSLLSIEYKGKEVISSASYHFSKIYHGDKEEVIAKPRSWTSKNLLKINFHFIKNFLQT